MEAALPCSHLSLRLIVMMTMMVILLHTSQSGATATISWKGNNTSTSNIAESQYSELELLMDSESSRRILAENSFTYSAVNDKGPATCSGSCSGPGTDAPAGENCGPGSYNRACHQYN